MYYFYTYRVWRQVCTTFVVVQLPTPSSSLWTRQSYKRWKTRKAKAMESWARRRKSTRRQRSLAQSKTGRHASCAVHDRSRDILNHTPSIISLSLLEQKTDNVFLIYTSRLRHLIHVHTKLCQYLTVYIAQHTPHMLHRNSIPALCILHDLL